MAVDCGTTFIRVLMNGLCTVITVAILLVYFFYFVFIYQHNEMDQDFNNQHIKLRYTFFVAVLIFCDVMALWSLATIYIGGPGYVNDNFRCERIEKSIGEVGIESEYREGWTIYALFYLKSTETKADSQYIIKEKDEEEEKSPLL